MHVAKLLLALPPVEDAIDCVERIDDPLYSSLYGKQLYAATRLNAWSRYVQVGVRRDPLPATRSVEHSNTFLRKIRNHFHPQFHLQHCWEFVLLEIVPNSMLTPSWQASRRICLPIAERYVLLQLRNYAMIRESLRTAASDACSACA